MRMSKDKDLSQKIRLIMNLIAPDTFEKKEVEIRNLMFKQKDGEGKAISLDEENLSDIVQTLFRKAQAEKDYGSMYAQLCQSLIQEEL
jgi:hypothetical protein